MIFNLKSRTVKIITYFLLTIFIGDILTPAIALAITSGSTQPEVFDYQPVDATDNVSLTTGGFNYTLPITSIPEYPMAISYRSGVKSDQEAGMFGFGFHGFPGAIGRNMMGLPDDINGAKKLYHFQNDMRWSASVTASLGVGFAKHLYKEIVDVNVGASLNVTGGYDNYTGIFGSVGLGLSLGVGKHSNEGDLFGINGPGGGLSLSNDSRNLGLTYGSYLSAGLSLSFSPKIKGTKIEIPFSLLDFGKEFSAFGNTESDFGNGSFSNTNSGANHFLSPLANIASTSKGWGVSLTLSAPVGGFNLSLTGRYSQNTVEHGVVDWKAYGYNYLSENSKRDINSISDMTIEGENSYPDKDDVKDGKPDPRTNPSYLQRDFFMVNAMGISGNMQLNQKEYGVVSRNFTRTQYRDININGLSLNTTRKEVYPWTSVNQARINREIDIIKILKKANPNDRDFDQVIFTERERESLTKEEHTFGKAEFKMRGDYAGEYNLASMSSNGEPNFKDREPNDFSLDQVSKTGGGGYVFLGLEQDMPLYVPRATGSTSEKFQQSLSLDKSTDIKYTTIGELLTRFSDEANIADVSNQLSQNFFSHYAYQKAGNKADNVILNDHIVPFNILKHLKDDLGCGSGYAASLIGSLEVKNTSGMKYIFDLPVFTKNSESLHLKGKGVIPPVIRGDDYNSFSNKERNKLSIKDDYIYPYAWLLTAVVGEDYVDFDNIIGPSDGDLGFWVKFKYVKAADDYRWRSPFTGLDHIEGALYTSGDDMYGMSTGLKEIYYVSEIESSEYLCKYNYQKRFDGLDAKARVNGEAYNSITQPKANPSGDMTGDNFQFAVTQIDLYKKNFDGNRSKIVDKAIYPYGKILRSTKFEYDYSLCPDVPNNLTMNGYTGITKANIPYIYNKEANGSLGTGKLTLRKVQDIAYDDKGVSTNLPSSNFSYFGDNPAEKDTYNPPYDPNQTDQWGSYSKNSKAKGKYLTNINYYNHYCEYNEQQADMNSKVYHLKSIGLPTGGAMEVEYKAQSYGYVQDKKPYDMRRIHVGGLRNPEGSKNTFVKIDVNDIYADEQTKGIAQPLGIKNCLSVGDTIYGEIAFYQEPRADKIGEDKLFLSSTKAKVVSIANPVFIDNLWYQELEVASIKEKDGPNKVGQPPFYYENKMYMYLESDQMRAVKESVVPSCSGVAQIVENYDQMEKDDIKDAIRKVIANFKSVFTPSSTFKAVLDGCFGTPGDAFYKDLSFIRTPIYKAKYTGTRVHSIKYSDQFSYATNPDDPNNVAAIPSVSGNVYYFDEKTDGTGRSSGVATIEPGGGESCVIDANKILGTGFMPSPSILSSKTAMAPYYWDTNASDNVRSRLKGKTVYEFFTPKDAGLQPMKYFKSISPKDGPKSPFGFYYLFGIWSFLVIKIKIFRKRIKIKIPFFFPLLLKWDRQDYYHKKSYAYTDFSDIYGRMKSVRQVNATGQEEASQIYQYYDINSGVPVYKNSYNSSGFSLFRPGKVDQAWSEAYYSKEADIKLKILYMKATTKRHFSYTSMKYSYIPPVLQKVTSTVDGVTTVTENTGFDYYTGEAIEVRSNDSYKNTKIKRTVPAFWKYSSMGPSFNNGNYLNMLTQPAESYLYLNQCDNNHVLGASVTTWSNSDWAVADYLQPNKVVNGSGYSYNYNPVSGSTVKGAYAATSSYNRYTNHNATLYRPYETYTYEVDLNKDGTFATFSPFPSDKWKRLNTNEVYSAKGAVIQSKDILDKYTSQQIGYNNSLPVSSVSNASYGVSVFEGAENRYYMPGSSTWALEGNRVKLLDAGLVEANGGDNFVKYTLLTNKYLYKEKNNPGHTPQALMVKLMAIEKPSSVLDNTVVAQCDVTFNNSVKRIISIILDSKGEYRAVSNRGEKFEGFVKIPNIWGTQKDYLLFDWDKLQSNTITPTSTPIGFNVAFENLAVESEFSCTNLPSRIYTVPASDNLPETHTGKYAFSLNPGKLGTEFTINPGKNANELKRKYKAFVWVHNSSPIETELVAQINTNGTQQEVKTTLVNPYVKAGGWSMLRVDFDLSNLTYNANPNLSDYAKVFVRNSSQKGLSVYDDIRVLPYQATMVNSIYDHAFGRVNATLDADHFATYNKYDARGRVIETIVEIENIGKETVKKYLYNDQKKQ